MLRNWQIKKSKNSTKHKSLSIHILLIFAPMNDLSDGAVQQTLAAVRTEGESELCPYFARAFDTF